MGRVVGCAYREWARRLIADTGLYDIDLLRYPDDLNRRCAFPTTPPDLIMLIGWSWMVPPEIYEVVPTICLHPSPLPCYRGGSPLQHQIMNGERASAVSIFRVTGDIDAGPIYGQCPISLDGSLAEIFGRIVQIGAPMLRMIADAFLRGEEPRHVFAQEVNLNPPLKRRTPEESQLTEQDIAGMTGEELSNFIRALDHPDYPRAFIRGIDGVKVELGWRG